MIQTYLPERHIEPSKIPLHDVVLLKLSVIQDGKRVGPGLVVRVGVVLGEGLHPELVELHFCHRLQGALPVLLWHEEPRVGGGAGRDALGAVGPAEG